MRSLAVLLVVLSCHLVAAGETTTTTVSTTTATTTTTTPLPISTCIARVDVLPIFAGQLGQIGFPVGRLPARDVDCEAATVPCYNVTIGNYISFSGCDGQIPFAPNGSSYPTYCKDLRGCLETTLEPLGKTTICCCDSPSCNYHN
ncbi:hypothetical protein QR680_014279 [Steinernema hermaphroditum]|uniref:Uncharacterized protein n=1 Tax=Steinernema hermaphroditum TaxID=289476 RepID=A0AA39M3Y6_9BILA|nr:hypothetical protein QR680_014279 [Steinernema hermaphroditum]